MLQISIVFLQLPGLFSCRLQLSRNDPVMTRWSTGWSQLIPGHTNEAGWYKWGASRHSDTGGKSGTSKPQNYTWKGRKGIPQTQGGDKDHVKDTNSKAF